jgi:hypothetical protein
MIILQPILPPLPPGQPTLLNLVTPGIPQIDGCQILTRVNAFVVNQGSAPVLEFTFRDRQTGTPIDLSTVFGSGGDSTSSSQWGGTVQLRVKEALSVGSPDADNPVWTIVGEPHDPVAGVVRAQLAMLQTQSPGIFFLSWGIVDLSGNPLLINNSLMSVERSLFASDEVIRRWAGPMTLMEVRTAIRDSGAAENLRLDDVEFSDDEIFHSILRPIEYYNEQPPPLRPLMTTKTFPWRFNWLQATISRLYSIAANWYRRNKQQLQAGGVSDDDLNRDQLYDARSQQLWQEYKEWVLLNKVRINAALFAGTITSAFDTGWL